MPNNTVPINFELNGLLKRLNYSFTVEGLGGNWPATVLPTSGEFTAVAKSGSVSAAVSFCSSSGCSEDTQTMPYSMTKTCTKDRSDVFAFVRLKASLVEDPSIQVFSDPVYVTCDTCIPNVSVELPEQYTLTNNIVLDNQQTATNNIEFTANVRGLVPKERYNYRYESVDANWPAKVYPPTGQILAAEDNCMIPTKVVFCEGTGVCPNGSDSVMAYDLDPTCMNNNQNFCNLRLYIEPDSCDYDEVYSNTMNLDCNDCLPKPILGIPSRLVLTENNNNYAEFVAIVSGIVPYRQYKYEYSAIRSNWPVIMDNITGMFHSPTNTYCIDSYVEFSEATGLAIQSHDKVLDYQLEDGCLFNKDDYEAKITMSVSALDCPDQSIKSNIMHLGCDDCFPPDPTPELSAKGVKEVSLSRGDGVSVQAKLTDLDVKKIYNYYIESEEGSNWPLYIPLSTGIIRPELSYQTIDFPFTLCESTGSCPSGFTYVMDYNPYVDTSKTVKAYQNDLPEYVDVRLYVQESDCQANIFESNIFRVTCTDCKLSDSVSFVSADIE